MHFGDSVDLRLSAILLYITSWGNLAVFIAKDTHHSPNRYFVNRSQLSSRGWGWGEGGRLDFQPFCEAVFLAIREEDKRPHSQNGWESNLGVE